MKKDLTDKGLRKVMQEPMPYRLPSNFTFRTMQKVEKWSDAERIQGCCAVQAGQIRLIDNIKIK